jgi:hypothetical protein
VIREKENRERTPAENPPLQNSIVRFILRVRNLLKIKEINGGGDGSRTIQGIDNT